MKFTLGGQLTITDHNSKVFFPHKNIHNCRFGTIQNRIPILQILQNSDQEKMWVFFILGIKRDSQPTIKRWVCGRMHPGLVITKVKATFVDKFKVSLRIFVDC